MKKQALHKIISIVLALAMIFTSVCMPANVTYAAASSEWTPLADIDAAAQAENSVAITMTSTDGTVYALPAADAESTPAAAVATAGEKLTIAGGESDFGWKITKNSDGTYNITNSAGNYLYVANSNSGVRVGAKPETGADFSVTDGYLNAAASDAVRYVGVYTKTPDWRCYKNTTTNIGDQTLRFWAFGDETEEPEDDPVSAEPEVTITPIAEALAGANDTEFTVKGVITLIDGKNVYIQDETGAIDLYLSANPSGISLGDTVTGTGKKTVYKGLPELTSATFEKVTAEGETLTLSAKETTIGALSDSDICTYVSLKDLEVTEVFDNNGKYSTPNITVKDSDGNTIQLYKAVVGKTDGAWDVKVGDTVDINAAVGIYNSYQLRNTLASEITVTASAETDEPEDPEVPAGETSADKGDLVTDLSQLTDGVTVSIYSPSHKTAVSSKPNGDWYLKAKEAVIADGKLTNFTEDYVWTIKVNDDGTYSFYAYGDETRSITTWPSGNYAELSLNAGTYPDNKWTLTAAKTEDCWYINSPTVSAANGPTYIEAYVRNETEVFSGYFTNTSANNFKESEFALQFYLVDPNNAVAAYDDGEWDGVLQKDHQYVIRNVAANASLGIYKEAEFAFDAIPTELVTVGETTLADPGNGAYLFTVGTTGRYYTFKHNGQYLVANNAEELLLGDANEDGSAPEEAKWFLTDKGDGYILYNKEANYNGTPVCIEYYSTVFSGWTFSTRNDVNIYLFNFYEVTEDTEIAEDTVQDPSALFDCADSKCFEQDFQVHITLDDLCEEITDEVITVTCADNSFTVDMSTVESSADKKSLTFTLPYGEVDKKGETEFTIKIDVTNGFGISYTDTKTVKLIDEPFFEDLTPAPNSQTREDRQPVISALVGNVGENPAFTMTVNGEEVEASYDKETGILSYKASEDMAEGRTTVKISVVREDRVTGEKTWSFTVGLSDYQLYFGQLHSHTTYSDGSGTLESALDYVGSLPESANVQFVAFTDHSNYFDTTSAANPADALNDASLMTEASRAVWNKYRDTVAAFNEKQSDVIAIAGFEMTWSGGPGHINTFDSDGLVSRNNAELNNKTSDAGMKLYYETINKGDSLNQFNHPGTTFGNFTDFSYWDEETDDHIFLVEVGNGEGPIGAGGYFPSYEQYILALDKGWHVAPTNNQDNHKGRWGNANEARDVVLTNEYSEEGIYDAIRNRRVYATEDRNLQIGYTVNQEYMGTILTELPEKLDVAVTLYDPDSDDVVTKVELVADGGKIAYTWDNAEELAGGELTAEIEPSYTYYFVRVTQKDGNLAVTAPVWTGMTQAVGITSIKSETDPVYVGEEATLVTTLFNNEEADAKVTSLVYTKNGGEVIGTDTTARTIPAGGTLEAKYTCTFDKAKITKVTVTAFMEDGDSFTANVEVDVIDKENENTVTPIADVRAASDPDDTGYRFVIEGTLTSNASGYDKDTAFFDCVYIQDETGGICSFPVSGEYKIGDKVRVVGHTDFYQGEPELQVKEIEVIGTGSVEPTEVTSAQISSREVEGMLITLKGTVESYEEANGLIQTIMVKDENGDTARVFIDGYITTGNEVQNCVEGADITVTGLASYDDTFNAPDGPFPRIRIRDRADVVCSTDALTYEVTLDPCGSSVSPATVTTGGSGVIEKDLPVPKDKEGFVFGGWFDAEEGGSRVQKGDTVSEDTTLYARWYELRARLAGDAAVPEALKGTYADIAAMEKAMLARLEKRTGRTFKDYAIYELLVEYNDGESWKLLEADMFPVKGVNVTAELPAGVSAADKPAVIHLFGGKCNGYSAGYMEIPGKVTVNGSQMTFKVNGTSPVLVGWGTAESSGSSASSGKSSGSSGSSASGSTSGSSAGKSVSRSSTKTGDPSDPLMWILIAAVSAYVFGMTVRRKRSR